MRQEPGASADGGVADPTGPTEETGLPSLAAAVCELRSSDDVPDGTGPLRARIVDILDAHGAEVDVVQGNPDATAGVFGPDRGDGTAAWGAVAAASEIRDAIVGAFGEATVRIGVAATDVDRDPASLGLWRTHVVDLATRLQHTAANDEAILNGETYRKVAGWVQAETAETDDPRGGTVRLLGVGAEPAPSAPADAPPLEQQLDGSSEAYPWTEVEALDPDDPDTEWPQLAIAALPDVAVEAMAEPDEGPERADAGWRLVGRDAELDALRSAFADVVGSGGAVVSVRGADGVGKTALVATFAAELTDAFVIPLDCPPLELGGTTRPLVSLIEALAGVGPGDETIAVRDAIRHLIGDGADADAERLAALVTGDGHALAPEVRPALTRLLQAASRHAPVVIVVDQATSLTRGAARTLTDLVHGVRSPVLAVLVHDGSGPIRADRDIGVRPLLGEAIAEIADATVGHGGLAPEARDTILGSVAGNPLAAQQAVAMLLDDGFLRWEYGRWVGSVDLATLSLPGEARALVDARIERLDAADRALLAAAAAFGDTFPIAGVVSDGAAQDRVRLDVLVERRLLAVVDEHEMAFAHPLVRRMAATSDPDTYLRAAAWLANAGLGGGPSAAELIGSRLALAARAGADPDVARRAAASLAAAAGCAAAFGDDDASLDLLRAATSLLAADDPTRTELLLESGLGIARRGDTFAAERIMAEAAMNARAANDARGEARADVLRASVRAAGGTSEGALERLRDVADAAIALCEPANDHTGLAWAWNARATVHRHRGHWAATADAAERAAAHAADAGRRGEEVAALLAAGRAVIDGPAPVAEARGRCETIAERLRGSTPAEEEVEVVTAVLLAREGRLDEARERADAAVAALQDSPHRGALARCLWLRALVEIVARDGRAAEPFLRLSIDASREAQDAGTRARAAGTLANVLVDLGTPQDVDGLIALARDGAGRDDVFAQVAWRCARAKQRAAEGRGGEARAQVRTAARLADQTDLVELRAATLLDHAEVMRLLGRPNEAQPSARKALRSLERHGAAASAERARAMIDLLQQKRGADPEPSAPVEDTTAHADPAAPPDGAVDDPATKDEAPHDPLGSDMHRPATAASDTPEHPTDPDRRERRWFW